MHQGLLLSLQGTATRRPLSSFYGAVVPPSSANSYTAPSRLRKRGRVYRCRPRKPPSKERGAWARITAPPHPFWATISTGFSQVKAGIRPPTCQLPGLPRVAPQVAVAMGNPLPLCRVASFPACRVSVPPAWAENFVRKSHLQLVLYWEAVHSCSNPASRAPCHGNLETVSQLTHPSYHHRPQESTHHTIVESRQNDGRANGANGASPELPPFF
jgi:hypothetical protein